MLSEFDDKSVAVQQAVNHGLVLELLQKEGIAHSDKRPIQLDLFEPVQQGHEFKVILTNKTTAAGKVARFHEGPGLSGEDLWGVEEPGANGICSGAPFGG